MLFRTRLSPSYLPLADASSETPLQQTLDPPQATARKFHTHLLSCCTISLILGLALGALLSTKQHAPSYQLTAVPSSPLVSSSSCQRLVIRREWRSLGPVEKQEYLSAVKCLTELPPVIETANRSAHDEFSWVHSMTGAYCE